MVADATTWLLMQQLLLQASAASWCLELLSWLQKCLACLLHYACFPVVIGAEQNIAFLDQQNLADLQQLSQGESEAQVDLT